MGEKTKEARLIYSCDAGFANPHTREHAGRGHARRPSFFATIWRTERSERHQQEVSRVRGDTLRVRGAQRPTSQRVGLLLTGAASPLSKPLPLLPTLFRPPVGRVCVLLLPSLVEARFVATAKLRKDRRLAFVLVLALHGSVFAGRRSAALGRGSSLLRFARRG